MWLTYSLEKPTDEDRTKWSSSISMIAAASQRHSRRALSTIVSSTASGSDDDRPSAISTSFIAANCSVASV